ncbi:MAG: RNA polymerase sigma factor [Lachnospiraceae bacterium]|nr:RNA polymerase sigma factor [Lachnospiraceae bacterium]
MSVNLQTEYDKIYKYCYFKVRNKDIAEDLTQETFLKYFSQNSYINKGKPLAYLYTIAKNHCIDYFRQKQTEALDDTMVSSDEMDAVITNIAVRQAVNNLDRTLAEIILLRFGSELGISEIGTILGISRFAVHRSINTALKQLKQVLKEEDFYE